MTVKKSIKKFLFYITVGFLFLGAYVNLRELLKALIDANYTQLQVTREIADQQTAFIETLCVPYREKKKVGP